MSKTNIDLITDFMKFGSPINQLFVIDAVSKLAIQVIAKQDQIRLEMKNSIIDSELWITAAKEWQAAYNKNYK